MNIYLLTVIVTALVNLWSNSTLKIKLKEKGYLNKSIILKSNMPLILIVNIISIFAPGLNLLMALASVIFTIRALNNDERLFGMFKGKMYSSEMIKRVYEKDNVEVNTLEDMFTLDGADEETKKSEIKKVESQRKGFEDKISRYGFIPSVPDFSESEYLWASSLEYAKAVLDAISLDVDLTDEEKKELLVILQKECKVELSGKEQSGEKVMKKILNVVE